MKKFLALTAILALALAACEQPADENKAEDKLPTLTIINSSSYDLTDVKFSGISFSSPGSDDIPRNNQAVGELSAQTEKVNYVTFVRKPDGIILQTSMAHNAAEEPTFRFKDNTVVDEVGNPNNTGKLLAQIKLQSQIAVGWNGLNVPRGDTVNLEGTTVNTLKQFEFTLKNLGSGELTFTGTSPVSVSGGNGAFSAVQPASSKIPPRGSLVFKINFNPNAIQAYTASVTISSDDPDGNFTFTVVADSLPLPAPGNARLTAVTDTSVGLAWDAVSGAIGYNVYRSGSVYGTYDKLNTGVIPEAVFIDTGLELLTRYYYKVCAVSPDNVDGAASNVVSAVTLLPAPGNVQVTAVTDTSVGLAWNAVSGANGYNVYRSDSVNGTYAKVNTDVIPAAPFTDTGLKAFTRYYYKVCAVSPDSVDGVKSDALLATTLQTAPAITTAALPNGIAGIPYNQTLTATGTAPAWSLASGALPTGLSLAGTGVISGTPTTAGTFTFTIKAANTAGSGTKQFSIAIILIEMVFIPGGSFQMGDTKDYNEYANEKPVHTVTLSGFMMGKYPVTQAQYQAVMGSNPSYFKGTSNPPASGEVQEKRPVEYVSWYSAIVFCNKLSEMNGLSPAYRISGSTNPTDWGTVPASNNSTWNAVAVVNGSTGYRLPTEAQWEYAAKGGNGSPGSYTYSGSNTVGDVAWYGNKENPGGNSGDKTHEVGKKAPNGLGLYDMSGNVFEWCWDWLGNYTSAAQTNPTGPSSGTHRVDRGGGWYYEATYTRSASRNANAPQSCDKHVGFRLVRP